MKRLRKKNLSLKEKLQYINKGKSLFIAMDTFPANEENEDNQK